MLNNCVVRYILGVAANKIRTTILSQLPLIHVSSRDLGDEFLCVLLRNIINAIEILISVRSFIRIVTFLIVDITGTVVGNLQSNCIN